MKLIKIVLTASLILSACFCFSQETKYSRVKIYTGKDGLTELARLGIAVDHGEIKKGVFFISDFSAEEIELIKSNGFKYEILIDDVVKHYQKQNEPSNDKSSKKSKTKKVKKKVFSGGCSATID